MKTLFDYQDAASNSIFDYWDSGLDNPLLIVPTGGGKSLIQADINKKFIELDSGYRGICLAHKQELITQNYEEFKNHCPGSDPGIYSASLGIKEKDKNITFAQVQSISKKIHEFDPFDVIFIDEAHLVPFEEGGNYRNLIRVASMMNPHIKLIGLTATHYRLDNGFLHTGEGAVFDGVAYEIEMRTLIERGRLVPVVSRAGAVTPDLSRVKVRAGEYAQGELQAAYDVPEVTKAACDEIIFYGQTRNAWLVFSAGVDHAHSVCNYFKSKGIDCEVITGKTGKIERELLIERFKAGLLKCLVNCDVLTTGFDAPICDLVAILRSTKSASLYVQMVGRGTRVWYEGTKLNCLLLDYGGNVEYHGFIDSVNIRDKLEKGEPGEAPVKACPECHLLLACSVRICSECGHEFPPPKIKHERRAYGGAVMSGDSVRDVSTSKVKEIKFSRWKKEGKPDSVLVSYILGNLKTVKEWVCLDHQGTAKVNAIRWCHSVGLRCNTTDQLLCSPVPNIDEIEYIKDGHFYQVIKRKLKEELIAV